MAVVGDMTQGKVIAFPQESEIQDLVEQLLSFGAEIIHCHHPSFMMQAVLTAKRCRLPLVLTLQVEPALIYRFLDTAKQWDIRPVVLSFSRRDIDVLMKRGVPEDRLHYVPAGTCAPSPARLHQRGNSPRPGLVLACPLTFRKGADVAVLAMAELRTRLGHQSPELNVYGEGNYGSYHEEMAAALGLEDIVHFHGPHGGELQFRADVNDILLVPSREETGPLVVLEAMSLGMPVVATDVGEVAQMLPDQRYGRVVPVNSIRALADAVESQLADIAAGEFSPALPIERHRSAYTAEKMATEVEQVYAQTARESGIHMSATLWTASA